MISCTFSLSVAELDPILELVRDPKLDKESSTLAILLLPEVDEAASSRDLIVSNTRGRSHLPCGSSAASSLSLTPLGTLMETVECVVPLVIGEMHVVEQSGIPILLLPNKGGEYLERHGSDR